MCSVSIVGFLGSSAVKNPPAVHIGLTPESGPALVFLLGKIPCVEGPGIQRSTGSQTVRHYWSKWAQHSREYCTILPPWAQWRNSEGSGYFLCKLQTTSVIMIWFFIFYYIQLHLGKFTNSLLFISFEQLFRSETKYCFFTAVHAQWNHAVDT